MKKVWMKKVLAVCVNDPFYNEIYEKEEVPQHVYDEIANFLKLQSFRR